MYDHVKRKRQKKNLKMTEVDLFRYAIQFVIAQKVHCKIPDPSRVLEFFFHEGDIELMIPSAPCYWALSVKSLQPRHIDKMRKYCDTHLELLIFDLTINIIKWIHSMHLSFHDIDETFVAPPMI